MLVDGPVVVPLINMGCDSQVLCVELLTKLREDTKGTADENMGKMWYDYGVKHKVSHLSISMHNYHESTKLESFYLSLSSRKFNLISP